MYLHPQLVPAAFNESKVKPIKKSERRSSGEVNDERGIPFWECELKVPNQKKGKRQTLRKMERAILEEPNFVLFSSRKDAHPKFDGKSPVRIDVEAEKLPTFISNNLNGLFIMA
nr:hypothetical protein HmN_000772600 [Hymenolepis microstoma]